MAHNTEIGKDILEMLMFSLYPEAETIYREYLQNASDSINEAIEIGILAGKDDGHVTINVDKYHSRITISDNGTGIKATDAEQRLKDIAKTSKKNKEHHAGFYGIGRLVGAGYCKKLTFKTSYPGEPVASEMVFDVEQIRRILEDDENEMSATNVIDTVTTFNNVIKEDADRHYFSVVMEDILPEYPILLDETAIYNYLCQVAPISYSPVFKNNLVKPVLTQDYDKYLTLYNNLNTVQVSLNNIVDIRKQYSTTIDGTGDEISKLRLFSLIDPKYGELAWGWYAITEFNTAIPDNDPNTGVPVLTRGMRLRVHNIQIGNQNFFDGTNYFRQARSNKYFNGEIHVINNRIKPTTDRSDLAPSPETLALKKLISEFFNSEMQKVYQTANKVKKELERFMQAEQEHAEVATKKITDDFPEQSRDSKLAEAVQKMNKAEEEISKLQQKKDTASQGIKDMLDVYQKKLNKFKEDVEKGDYPNNRKDVVAVQINVAKPTIDEEIANLEARYGSDGTKMLRKVFHILDTRYYNKYEQIIKSIKSSIINDLKK